VLELRPRLAAVAMSAPTPGQYVKMASGFGSAPYGSVGEVVAVDNPVGFPGGELLTVEWLPDRERTRETQYHVNVVEGPAR
jgi:hypothetical protein